MLAYSHHREVFGVGFLQEGLRRNMISARVLGVQTTLTVGTPALKANIAMVIQIFQFCVPPDSREWNSILFRRVEENHRRLTNRLIDYSDFDWHCVLSLPMGGHCYPSSIPSIAPPYTTNSGSARVITRVSASTASRRNLGTANIPWCAMPS